MRLTLPANQPPPLKRSRTDTHAETLEHHTTPGPWDWEEEQQQQQAAPTWGAGEERGAGAVGGLEAVPEAGEAEPRLVELGALPAVDRLQRGERRHELGLPGRQQLRHGPRWGGRVVVGVTLVRPAWSSRL
jgi:hypothetical protein